MRGLGFGLPVNGLISSAKAKLGPHREPPLLATCKNCFPHTYFLQRCSFLSEEFPLWSLRLSDNDLYGSFITVWVGRHSLKEVCSVLLCGVLRSQDTLFSSGESLWLKALKGSRELLVFMLSLGVRGRKYFGFFFFPKLGQTATQSSLRAQESLSQSEEVMWNCYNAKWIMKLGREKAAHKINQFHTLWSYFTTDIKQRC